MKIIWPDKMMIHFIWSFYVQGGENMNTFSGKVIFQYISQSVIGMIGISIYILADTFFISRGFGSDGLAVLNMALPVYGLIYTIGSMIGIGSATVYSIHKSSGEKYEDCFMQSVSWSLLFSIPFVLLGIFIPKTVLTIMGADPSLAELGKGYMRIILCAAPLFMCNYTFTGFCRNDNAPANAMLGSIAGSLFNIVFDYIFMFPMGLGFSGAAFATAFCPVVTMSICAIHFLGKDNHVQIHYSRLSLKHLKKASSIGTSSFVGEISSGMTSLIFNYLMLGLAGNTAVATYGIVANIALVCTSIFNGIAQGVQPLISNAYGKDMIKETKRLLRISLLTAFASAIIFIAVGYIRTDALTGIFNSQNSHTLLVYAHTGLRLYFPGFLISGINISLISYFSAIGQGKIVVAGSLLRGMILNTICAFILSKTNGMNGVWLSFPVAETLTLIIILILYKVNMTYHKRVGTFS